jgi:hypothetical protein
MNVHTCAFNLAIEGDSEVMGQDGLPSTRARGPVRGRDDNHQVFSSPRLSFTAWLSFGLSPRGLPTIDQWLGSAYYV